MLSFGGLFFLFFVKQKTAYEMRISDWSSDVCSSDLVDTCLPQRVEFEPTLDPGEAVPERRSNTLEVVCVASMQARLQATVHFKIGRASCRDRVCKYV